MCREPDLRLSTNQFQKLSTEEIIVGSESRYYTRKDNVQYLLHSTSTNSIMKKTSEETSVRIKSIDLIYLGNQLV